MSVKILVVDRFNKVVSGANVFVLWKSGTSNRKTNENGIADLECSAGTAIRITIDGDEVVSGEFFLEDKIIRFNHPRK